MIDAIDRDVKVLSGELEYYDRVVHGDRKGDWISLYSGRRYWPGDPRPGDFDVADIAHGLSLVNRYCGHTRHAYSVAQHSVLVSRILPRKYKFHGLMHDASEAYIHDITSPLKRQIKDAYGPLEDATMAAICSQFGLDTDGPGWGLVKRADMVLLATELRDLTAAGCSPRNTGELPLEEKIECWPAAFAEETFLEEFHKLWPNNKAKSTRTSPATPQTCG